jgi:citrate/tricarballylate utilization protein
LNQNGIHGQSRKALEPGAPAMQSLEALARAPGRWPAATVVPDPPAETEVARQMQICNACRYCEGFCAVFPAMTRRLEFGKADVHYLANLCHNCGACLHACQYAPPHEFASTCRRPWRRCAARPMPTTPGRPRWARCTSATASRCRWRWRLALALFLVLAVCCKGRGWVRCGARRAATSTPLPAQPAGGLFAPVFLFAVLALGMGVRRFWRDVTPATSGAGPRPPRPRPRTPCCA